MNKNYLKTFGLYIPPILRKSAPLKNKELFFDETYFFKKEKISLFFTLLEYLKLKNIKIIYNIPKTRLKQLSNLNNNIVSNTYSYVYNRYNTSISIELSLEEMFKYTFIEYRTNITIKINNIENIEKLICINFKYNFNKKTIYIEERPISIKMYLQNVHIYNALGVPPNIQHDTDMHLLDFNLPKINKQKINKDIFTVKNRKILNKDTIKVLLKDLKIWK